MSVDQDFMVVLKSHRFGEGEPELGERLLKIFLSVLLESGQLPAKIVCLNTGVFLTTRESPVLELLKRFEAEGVQIFSCGTCLEYFQAKDQLKVGQAGNMRDTVRSMLSCSKILEP